MAHGNQADDSFSELAPLLKVRSSQSISDRRVSPVAMNNLGSYTGEKFAVCVYESVRHPALVAFETAGGTVLWTSAIEDLPGAERRWINGIAIGKAQLPGGKVRRMVFACNPSEFVAFGHDGARLWKRPTAEVVKSEQVGTPSSLRFTPTGELVCVTSNGWLVKLDPLDGCTVDAYPIDASVEVGGKSYRGRFVWTKSPAVVGNVLYFAGGFRPHPSNPLAPRMCPIHLVRIDLNNQQSSPQNLPIGVFRSGGSPPALSCADGKVVLFAHSSTREGDRLLPTITAVEDDAGTLTPRWRSLLKTGPWDDVHAAPALHPKTGALLVSTGAGVHVFAEAASLEGEIPGPRPIPGGALLTPGTVTAGWQTIAGSPITLAEDPSNERIVGYTNLRVSLGWASYGFIAAFALTVGGGGLPPVPLWTRPLASTPYGLPLPGIGTTGQIAPFPTDGGSGLIVNTVATGTHIFR